MSSAPLFIKTETLHDKYAALLSRHRESPPSSFSPQISSNNNHNVISEALPVPTTTVGIIERTHSGGGVVGTVPNLVPNHQDPGNQRLSLNQHSIDDILGRRRIAEMNKGRYFNEIDIV